jgi:hypothetical protein
VASSLFMSVDVRWRDQLDLLSRQIRVVRKRRSSETQACKQCALITWQMILALE